MLTTSYIGRIFKRLFDSGSIARYVFKVSVANLGFWYPGGRAEGIIPKGSGDRRQKSLFKAHSR